MVLGSPKVRKGMMCIRPSRTPRSDCWGGGGGGGEREREREREEEDNNGKENQ